MGTGECLAKPQNSTMFCKICWPTEGGYIITLEHIKDANFDRYGNLNSSGKIQFWKELDYIIKKFDRGDISLKAQKPKDK